MAKTIWVNKNDLNDMMVDEAALPVLSDGMVRLRIESFAVTANNVTYAVAGDKMGYWNFFPAPVGYGIVPMWGHAVIEHSNNAELKAGERVYGYLPMAEYVDVLPAKITHGGFFDAAPHRLPMSPIYNQYSRLAADPEHEPAQENQRMIFAPLFKTGFLIEDFMRRNDWFGAQSLIMTSASSKTSLGLASCAKNLSPGIKRIGLTSPANMAFTLATGLYDEVVAYGDIDDLPITTSVIVDFAGNSSVLHKVHNLYASNLKYSCLVGATHVGERSGGVRDITGPTPILFFAPTHAVSAIKDAGIDMFNAAVAIQWRSFLDATADTMTIDIRSGINCASVAFKDILTGKAAASVGIVVQP